jgi:outer membrane protein TolC
MNTHFKTALGPLLLSFLIPVLAGYAREELSLEAGWELVRQHHGSIAAAQSQIDSRRSLESATRGLLRPQIDLETRYTHLDSQVNIDLEPVRQVMLALHPQVDAGRIPPFVTTVQERDFTRATLIASWPVYTGGRIQAARGAARAAVSEAHAMLDLTEAELLKSYVQRYGSVVLALQSLNLQREREQSLERHLKRAELLAAAGQIAQVDVLHARVTLGEAQRDRSRAESSLRVAREALDSWTGRNAPADETLETLPLIPIPPSLSPSLTADMDRHPALERLQHLEDQASYGLKAEKGRWHPEVYLFGKRELIESGLTLLDPEWAVGLGLRWSILDRSSRRDRVLSAGFLLRQLRETQQQAERDLATLALQSLEQWKQAMETHAQLVGVEELTEEALRMREHAFAEGQATSLDVVDAQLAYQRVQLAKALARYESVVAAVKTSDAMGEVSRFWQWKAMALE